MIINLNCCKKLKKNEIIKDENYHNITPIMVKFYKDQYKELFHIYKNEDKVILFLYKSLYKKYSNVDDINYSLERVYIKTKLGSYLSGGCGIGPSLLTSLLGSGIFTYMYKYLEKLNNILSGVYFSIITFIAIYLLTMVDNEVEMYNLMLEIIEKLEKENMDR